MTDHNGGGFMRIAVAGGDGGGGRHECEGRAPGRRPPAAVGPGEGLEAALDGTDRLGDVTNVVTLSRRTAMWFFEAASHHLLQASGRAGIEHLVTLSIVGVDRVNLGYYAGKRHQEELVLGGDRPGPG